MRRITTFFRQYGVWFLIAGLLGAGAFWFFDPLMRLYHILADRQAVKGYIESWGPSAPLVFIMVQVLQVMLAPVPGEVSGFVGGYLFGTFTGFVYSSIGLAMGSAVNFWIGRLLGNRFVRKIIPAAQLKKLDQFISHQGIVVLLLCFIFPGFPKDYLCLFLGLTALPFNVFILLAALGRMPGTLMLSLQGHLLYQQNYWTYLAMILICIVAAFLALKYKTSINQWVERANKPGNTEKTNKIS
jgi:uncharacterized membrane protein YdjX (TVP38/TMEM64 family)